MKSVIRSFLLAVTLNTCSFYGFAQWQPSDENITRLDVQNIEQCELLTKRTTEGDIVLSWARIYSNDNNDSIALFMQVFDKNGVMSFPDEGFPIVKQPSRLYTTSTGMCLATNGDVLFSIEDARNESIEKQTDVYAYRYQKDGTSVWSNEGIQMPYHQQKSNMLTREFMLPNIFQSGENIFVTAVLAEYVDVTDPESVDEDEVNYYLQVMRLSADGTIEAENIFALNFPYYYAADGPDGTLYVITTSTNYGFWAMRLGSDCNNVWPYKKTIEPISQSALNTISRIQGAQLLSDGSLAFIYNRPVGTYASAFVVNRLMPDGSCGMGESKYVHGEPDGWSRGVSMVLHGDSLLLFNSWGESFNSGTSDMYAIFNLMSKSGDYLWQADARYGISLAEDLGLGRTFEIIGIIPQNNGCVVLYGGTLDNRFEYANYYAHKIDYNGNTLWRKRILPDGVWLNTPRIEYDEQNVYLFFTKEIFSEDGMYFSVIDISDEHNTAIDNINAIGEEQGWTKRLVNGQVLLFHGDKIYNILGMPIEQIR